MNGRCKTCLYWYTNDVAEESGACQHIRVGNTDDDAPTRDGLFVGSFDDHVAVIVGPEFGCVHHVEDE